MSKCTKVVIGLLVATIVNMMAGMAWAYKKYNKLSNEWWEIRQLYREMRKNYTRLFARFTELMNDSDRLLKGSDLYIEHCFEEDIRNHDAVFSR